MIKIGNKFIGEDPAKQLKLERKRFAARQKKLSEEESIKKSSLLEEGNKPGQTHFK